MSKKTLPKISSRVLVVFDNINEPKYLYLEDCFNKIIKDFIQDHEEVFSIIQTISITGILLEAVIKERLYDINPALILDNVDAKKIAIISDTTSKHDRSEVKTSSITTLMKRYEEFYEFPEQPTLISFLNIRNKLMHSSLDCKVKELTLMKLLVDHVFKFLEKHIDVDKNLWTDFLKISKVYVNEYKVDLLRNIISSREHFETLSPHEVQDAITSKLSLGSDDVVVRDCLPCPACDQGYTSYILSADFEYSKEDGQLHGDGYYHSYCRACKLELYYVDIEEITSDPETYFKSPEVAEEWDEIIKEHEFDYSDVI